MNNIYKVIWSKAKNCYVVASEIARSHTKSATGSEKIGGVTRRSLLASLMALSLLCGGLGVASAVDGTVNVDESTPGTAVVYTTEGTQSYVQSKLDGYYTKAGVDDKIDEKIEALTTTGAVATNKDNIITLQGKTTGLSDDGKSLTDMNSVETDALKVTRNISDGNVTTTLAEIDASMTQTKTNKKDIVNLKATTGNQDTAIKDLQKKTTNISYADGAGTSIDGITVKDGNIVGNGNSAITGLTNVETGNINGKSLVGTTVATAKDVEDAVKAETDARTVADTALEGKITKNSQDIATLDGKVTTAQGDIQTNANSIQTNSNAIADTNKRTGGIKRNIEDTQTTIENKVTVNGSGDVGGVKGLSAETINTTGDAAIGGKLNVTSASDLKGDVTLGTPNGTNTVTVNGTANFYAAAKMNNDLTVTGDTNLGNTTVDGNLKVTNTITTGKVTMDYADVMKDLGVYGNTTLGEAGKDTTLTVNSKATFNEIATFENGAEVKNGMTVSSGGLNVTGESTFNDKVNMKNGLDVTGGVASDSFTVKGTDIKIDSSGINAGGTVISNVADGSISEGSKDAVNGGQLYQVKNDLEGKVNKVGANAAAMANLHPMEFDPDSKWNIAAAIGNYGSETAAALGAFYRPNDDVMVNLSTAFGTGENMVGGGVSVRLGKGGNKLSREETNALKAQVNDLTARMDALLSVLNPNMSKDFPDVPENHWAYEAVSRLAGNDIVQGYPDGEFHGERTMTRYEMAEIIYNALSRGAEAEKELVEEFKPELQAMAASEKATAERAEG